MLQSKSLSDRVFDGLVVHCTLGRLAAFTICAIFVMLGLVVAEGYADARKAGVACQTSAWRSGESCTARVDMPYDAVGYTHVKALRSSRGNLRVEYSWMNQNGATQKSAWEYTSAYDGASRKHDMDSIERVDFRLGNRVETTLLLGLADDRLHCLAGYKPASDGGGCVPADKS